jgi:hypothetical protein
VVNLPIGPDGMLILYALAVSVIIAVLSWRRVRFTRAGAVIGAVAVALALVQSFTLDPADIVRQLVRASFIVVPSVVLLAASRVMWLAQRAWLLLVAGPVAFIGCYAGICEICYRVGLI